MISAILAAISAVFGVFKGVLDRFFPPKSPEQRERERIVDEVEERKKKAHERNTAIKDAKSGRTGGLERILNRRK